MNGQDLDLPPPYDLTAGDAPPPYEDLAGGEGVAVPAPGKAATPTQSHTGTAMHNNTKTSTSQPAAAENSSFSSPVAVPPVRRQAGEGSFCLPSNVELVQHQHQQQAANQTHVPVLPPDALQQTSDTRNEEDRMGRFGPKGANLYVKNVPRFWNKDDLANKFAFFGVITSCHVLRKLKARMNEGAGFVCYGNHEAAENALKHMHARVVGRGEERRQLCVSVKEGEEEYCPPSLQILTDRIKTQIRETEGIRGMMPSCAGLPNQPPRFNNNSFPPPSTPFPSDNNYQRHHAPTPQTDDVYGGPANASHPQSAPFRQLHNPPPSPPGPPRSHAHTAAVSSRAWGLTLPRAPPQHRVPPPSYAAATAASATRMGLSLASLPTLHHQKPRSTQAPWSAVCVSPGLQEPQHGYKQEAWEGSGGGGREEGGVAAADPGPLRVGRTTSEGHLNDEHTTERERERSSLAASAADLTPEAGAAGAAGAVSSLHDNHHMEERERDTEKGEAFTLTLRGPVDVQTAVTVSCGHDLTLLGRSPLSTAGALGRGLSSSERLSAEGSGRRGNWVDGGETENERSDEGGKLLSPVALSADGLGFSSSQTAPVAVASPNSQRQTASPPEIVERADVLGPSPRPHPQQHLPRSVSFPPGSQSPAPSPSLSPDGPPPGFEDLSVVVAFLSAPADAAAAAPGLGCGAALTPGVDARLSPASDSPPGREQRQREGRTD
uniref:RRM domain-containing protein n=1 Tax=Chromera velia CCMP2878 TaxID=1169474 RepID=A0A0G4HJX5_9ALVE|eukprot:Cvel_7198.t1-p1 / transcript=Cvel_7198.t1 / gene=Cvel_7198 / organism=Chromera_velia_CCMP2878 / gene_product=Polyadenylate-binding protein 5, putative / transcript_product=Polyadenylate-binding protein 5, putative / location=Cvel_scaffold370:82046-85479(-) / protein_length=717 / sequence_SO=supercontig / SO=protein_coding / is_pseudo=false